MKMRNIWSVMRKEFARFFKDKRLVVSSLILPGVMIYLVYSLMGNAMGAQFNTQEDYQYTIEAVNMPESMKEMFGAAFSPENLELIEVETFDYDEATEAISEKEIDCAMVFEENFDTAVGSYASGDISNSTAVNIYFNSTITESETAYSMVKSMVEGYESSVSDLIKVNAGEEKYDLATDRDYASFMMAMLMPMLLITFLFNCCMAVAPESIAGEKERGTMATLLVTPIKRSELAMGKILSLSIMSLCCGLSSFLGIILALPNYMASMMTDLDVQVYGVKEYAWVLIIIFATVLLIVSLISVISAYSSTVKEANTYIAPVMIISMLLGVTTMFTDGAMQSIGVYFIPLFNSVQCFAAIFGFGMNTVNILITFGSNLVYAIILGAILTRMFNSEKIMFKK